jgi:alcohol dehydrogenase
MAKLNISFPTFRQPSLMTFGTGSLGALAAEDLGDSLFFLSGREEVLDTLAASLARRGRKLDPERVLRKPPGEPTLEMVEEAARWLDGRPCERLVAIGGGSVLDWCRLAWAESRKLLSFEAGRAEVLEPAERPELWLVPTTCGTGAEAASVVVLTRGGRKLPFQSPAFLASRVILDGRFLELMSAGDLAASLCDALSHGIEGFLSIIPCRLAKEAAVSALRWILEAYPAAPVPSRNECLMEAGFLGGLAASNCSVGVVHAFAHALTSHGVSHRLGNALGLAAGVAANSGVPALSKLTARLGMASAGDLIAAIEPVTRAALESVERAEIVSWLRDAASRNALIDRMLDDICLRTNPRTLGRGDLELFLEDVAARLERQ